MCRQVERRDRRASLQGGFGVDVHVPQERQEGQQDPLERPRDRQENPVGGFGVDAPQVQ